MQLAQGEITELKAQLRCNVRVGLLLLGKRDVEAHRCCSHVVGAPVRGLHRAGPPTGDHHEAIVERPLAITANPSAEISGDRVVAALRERTASSSERLVRSIIARREARSSLGFLQLPLRVLWVDQGRAAKYDDRRVNAQLLEREFRFQVLELKADGAQFGSIEKL